MNGYLADLEKRVEAALESETARIQLSLMDKVRGAKGALKRLIAKGITNPDSYCSAQVAAEREVCCTTCRPEGNCPYCGCSIGIKKPLATESCPNPKTYPHLKVFPPRDYWQVCHDSVSVIIAARNEPHLNDTIKSLLENATGTVEIIAVLDGYKTTLPDDPRVKVIRFDQPQGTRAAYNKAADIATGTYLLIIDAHCTMSFGWDTKLKCACGDRSLVVSVLRPLDEKSWEILPIKKGEYSFVYLDKTLQEKWWSGCKDRERWKIIEPTMAFTGCGWMIRKDYFRQLGRFDTPALGQYGYIGPEFTLKVWLHEKYGGQILLRTDVVCGHLFGTNTEGKLYKASTMPHEHYYRLMMRRWGSRLPALIRRFAPVPSWEEQPPPKKTPKAVTRQIKVEKTAETVVRDKKGNVISRKVQHYDPVFATDDGSGDIKQIRAEMAARAKPKQELEINDQSFAI